MARGEDRPDSDVDLLAGFLPGLGLFGLSLLGPGLSGLGRLQADLEGIPGTRVDLIPAADLQTGRPRTR